MKTEELFELLDKATSIAYDLEGSDADAYGELTATVQQLALCIDDGTITEDQPGFKTALYLVNQLIESNFLEF